ncbi:hypothetical protein SAMN05216298_0747 [Glycomyces sambucus]|uniref:Uncharacterized protein n=1 Tax=Glycomyces sambucus TaxID=380244 RepID=A0A1G9D951_9ACTN|nr:hypothetical protein [Glycomyces sambucus]SDK60373.1 hypothetical protein SAMN05216298_0747 [Glycomyces sambucus]
MEPATGSGPGYMRSAVHDPEPQPDPETAIQVFAAANAAPAAPAAG